MSNVPTLPQRVMAAHPLMEVPSPSAMAVSVRDSAMVPLPGYQNMTIAQKMTLLPLNMAGTTVPVELSMAIAPLMITATAVMPQAMVRMS